MLNGDLSLYLNYLHYLFDIFQLKYKIRTSFNILKK